jgi:hypothetical protein
MHCFTVPSCRRVRYENHVCRHGTVTPNIEAVHVTCCSRKIPAPILLAKDSRVGSHPLPITESISARQRHGFQRCPLRPRPVASPPLRSRRDSHHPCRHCSSPHSRHYSRATVPHSMLTPLSSGRLLRLLFHSVHPHRHAVHSCPRHCCTPAFRSAPSLSSFSCSAFVILCPRRCLVADSSATSQFYFASTASLSSKLLAPHICPPPPLADALWPAPPPPLHFWDSFTAADGCDAQ